MIQNKKPEFLITLDKLYYKAYLPEQVNAANQPKLRQILNKKTPEVIGFKKFCLVLNENKKFNFHLEYTKKYEIKYGLDGICVGFLFFRPNYIHGYQKTKEIVGIHITNFVFYQEYFGIMLKALHQDLGLKFKHYTALDIALDKPEDLISKFEEFYNDVKLALDKKYKVDFQPQPYKMIRCSHFTIYDKTKEMLQKSMKKKYISEYFENNGFRGQRMYRCELRLGNAETKDYDIDLFQLHDPKYLISIYDKFQKRYMDFKLIRGKCSSRWPRKPLIHLVSERDFERVKKTRSLYGKKVSSHSAKIALKQFYWAIKMCKNEQMNYWLANYIKEHKLDQWVEENKGKFMHPNPDNFVSAHIPGIPFGQ